ncbi:type II secretion system protein [Shewanella canadensis]|uniref:Type II secretion system protein n=1 Tax=Shewanella canadensis TaxID=271096 RepID=A0A3S0KX29_9GAMM|nr:type II secretion system protein [Shewanella canadensis]RTR40470.1 type II secretion system protein [Shewanella canadensis]
MRTALPQSGFTLVELVTTIILIAILSVVVLPRLMTSSSYSAFTLRDEFVSELRKAQLLAMNNRDSCYRIVVDTTGYQLQGFINKTCTGTPTLSETRQIFEGRSSLELDSDNSKSFMVNFDRQGIASLGCSGNCINVIADETLTISIESQGYIHGR